MKTKGEVSITRQTYTDHFLQFVKDSWRGYLAKFIFIFGVLWAIVEVWIYSYPLSVLNSSYVSLVAILGSVTVSFLLCINDYLNRIPHGLEYESKRTHEIVRQNKPFWEFALAHCLLHERIQNINDQLEDLISNRVHVTITKKMGVNEYMDWLELRPENLIRLVDIAQQLLITDFLSALQSKKKDQMDISALLTLMDRVRDMYRRVYEFEIEGREILVPEGFEKIHEIQSEWSHPIKDGVEQMIKKLEEIAERGVDDFLPIDISIEFLGPPRIDEYCEELNRLHTKIFGTPLPQD